MLRIAKNVCKQSKIISIDITKENLKDKFDVVTAFRFFLNAEDRLRVEALSAIYNILEDDGYLITNIHVNTKSIMGLMYRIINKFYQNKNHFFCPVLPIKMYV